MMIREEVTARIIMKGIRSTRGIPVIVAVTGQRFCSKSLLSGK
jgi:hypothetical protein